MENSKNMQISWFGFLSISVILIQNMCILVQKNALKDNYVED